MLGNLVWAIEFFLKILNQTGALTPTWLHVSVNDPSGRSLGNLLNSLLQHNLSKKKKLSETNLRISANAVNYHRYRIRASKLIVL